MTTAENETVSGATKIFETARKMIAVLEDSEIPDGPLKAAVIKIVALTYNMKAAPEKR